MLKLFVIVLKIESINIFNFYVIDMVLMGIKWDYLLIVIFFWVIEY